MATQKKKKDNKCKTYTPAEVIDILTFGRVLLEQKDEDLPAEFKANVLAHIDRVDAALEQLSIATNNHQVPTGSSSDW